MTLDSTGHYPGLDILDDPFLRYPVDEIKCNTFLPDGQPVFGWPIRSPNNGYVFYTRIHDKEPVLYQLAMETILSPDFRTPDPEPDNFFAHSRSAEQRMACMICLVRFLSPNAENCLASSKVPFLLGRASRL